MAPPKLTFPPLDAPPLEIFPLPLGMGVGAELFEQAKKKNIASATGNGTMGLGVNGNSLGVQDGVSPS
jgi:hypothetical protein